MKLNAGKLAVAAALAFAGVWIICSAMVALLPVAMMNLSGDMLHADLGTMMVWSLDWVGFVVGLIAWSLSAGVTAWLIAMLYNWQMA